LTNIFENYPPSQFSQRSLHISWDEMAAHIANDIYQNIKKAFNCASVHFYTAVLTTKLKIERIK